MSTKAKAAARVTSGRAPRPVRASAPGAAKQKQNGPIAVDGPIPGTSAWHLNCIVLLGQRIQEYIQFMGKVQDMTSSSAEAKEKALVAFHERLAVMEQQLGRIHDEVQLG